MKFSFDIFGKRAIFYAKLVKRPYYWTHGLTSRIPGTSFHVHLLDYDLIRLDFLEEELLFLQEVFKLTDFHIFKTKEHGIFDDSLVGGFHALCLDTDMVANILKVLRSSNCDYAFRNAPMFNPERAWVLRIGEKGETRPEPEFVKTMAAESDIDPPRLQSSFHARLLDKWYGLEIEDSLTNPDGSNVGHEHFYDTAKRVA